MLGSGEPAARKGRLRRERPRPARCKIYGSDFRSQFLQLLVGGLGPAPFQPRFQRTVKPCVIGSIAHVERNGAKSDGISPVACDFQIIDRSLALNRKGMVRVLSQELNA